MKQPPEITTLMKVRNAFATVLVIFLTVTTPSANAQESLKIVAVINDDIVSAFDLQSRTMLVTILSKLPRNQQTIKRLSPRVLRLLIDEKLKLQEAERMGIDIAQPEIEAALVNAENIHNYRPGELVELLERLGIGVDTLLEQIRSDIAWSRIVPRKYGQNVTVSEEEINQALQENIKQQNQPQYLLSELVLAVDSPSNLPTIQEQAQELIRELQNGADFESLSRAFSQAPSAPNGGSLSWLRIDQLPDSIVPVVQSMQPGQISNPISIPGALMIILLREVRHGAIEKKTDTIVELQQFHLDLPGDATNDVVQSYVSTARERTENVSSCADLSESGRTFGSPLSGGLGKVGMSNLPTEISQVVGALPVSTPSKPIRTADAVIVLMVCERVEPKEDTTETMRDRVHQRIFGERMAVYARQAIRDLRRSAFIEIR